jgi:nuclear transport factor 2 (NTF2) superfamily protein
VEGDNPSERGVRREIVAFLASHSSPSRGSASSTTRFIRIWCFEENRIAVRFQYECLDRDRQWWRSYGNEIWEFDEHGLMTRREASINDIRIAERDRRILGPRTSAEGHEESPLQ